MNFDALPSQSSNSFIWMCGESLCVHRSTFSVTVCHTAPHPHRPLFANHQLIELSRNVMLVWLSLPAYYLWRPSSCLIIKHYPLLMSGLSFTFDAMWVEWLVVICCQQCVVALDGNRWRGLSSQVSQHFLVPVTVRALAVSFFRYTLSSYPPAQRLWDDKRTIWEQVPMYSQAELSSCRVTPLHLQNLQGLGSYASVLWNHSCFSQHDSLSLIFIYSHISDFQSLLF